MINNEVNQGTDLNGMEEEGDSQLILHVTNARAKCFKSFLLLFNYSDAVTCLNLFWLAQNKNRWENMREYGLQECQQHITINCLGDILDSW